MAPNAIAFLVGALIGGFVIGAACGLVPLALSKWQNCLPLGIASLILCVVCGAVLGLLLALPVAVLTSVVILIFGRPAPALLSLPPDGDFEDDERDRPRDRRPRPFPAALVGAIVGGVALLGAAAIGVGFVAFMALKPKNPPAEVAADDGGGGPFPQRGLRLQPGMGGPDPGPWQPAALPPEPPRRPAFDLKLARPAALTDGRFETRAAFDDADPADRNSTLPAKAFALDLKADQPYLASMAFEHPGGMPLLRLEDAAGRTQASGEQRNGQGPTTLLFVAPKAGTYCLIASAHAAPGEFALSVCRFEEGDPLPSFEGRAAPGTPRPPKLARTLDPFLAAAVAPDSRTAWVSYPDKRLERIDCPSFASGEVLRLPRPCYRLAADGRGMLYAAAQIDGGPAAPAAPAAPRVPKGPRGGRPVRFGKWEPGLADLEIYDLRGERQPGATLAPARTIPLRGVLAHLCVSPDDRWLYYLDAHNRKVGRLALPDGTPAGEAVGLEPGTNGLCLTPDGRTLYACSKENAVQALDPATLAVRKTIRFAGANPTGIQATDGGYVFLQSGNGQWTHVYLLYANRDYGEGLANVLPWADDYASNAIALAPDQQTLYASCFHLSPSHIESFAVPPRPTLAKGRSCGPFGANDIGGRGLLTVSPDSKFLLCDNGQILSLGR